MRGKSAKIADIFSRDFGVIPTETEKGLKTQKCPFCDFVFTTGNEMGVRSHLNHKHKDLDRDTVIRLTLKLAGKRYPYGD